MSSSSGFRQIVKLDIWSPEQMLKKNSCLKKRTVDFNWKTDSWQLQRLCGRAERGDTQRAPKVLGILEAVSALPATCKITFSPSISLEIKVKEVNWTNSSWNFDDVYFWGKRRTWKERRRRNTAIAKTCLMWYAYGVWCMAYGDSYHCIVLHIIVWSFMSLYARMVLHIIEWLVFISSCSPSYHCGIRNE